MYYINELGQIHRTDGPAAISDDGSLEWWVDGRLHRTDGPAIEYADGHKEWRVNGQRHRTDGPAVIRAEGREEWWVNNQLLTEFEVWLLAGAEKVAQ